MITVHSFSEVGGHSVNEDSFVAKPHPLDPNCWLVFLADGQGGRAGGFQASRLATQAACDAALQILPRKLLAASSWSVILSQVDQAVTSDKDAGFTTLIGASIFDDYVTGASSGDSAVLAVAGNSCVELTRNQIKNPPVGSGSAVFAPFAFRLTQPWSVLVISDGVWKYVGMDQVAKLAAQFRGEALIEELKSAARMPGNCKFQDDFTIVIAEHL